MRFKFFKATFVAVFLLICNVSNAGIIPHGVQENVAYNDVTNTWGWDLLYRGDYSASISIDDMFSGHQDYIMLGAINGDSDTITLLAAVRWSDFITYTADNVTKSLNGAEWYINGDSLGFAGLGDTINQTSADTSSVNANKRLSWHTNRSSNSSSVATDVFGGWRAGAATGLNGSTAWDRVVFTANANVQSVPEPSTLAIFALGMVGLVLRRTKK